MKFFILFPFLALFQITFSQFDDFSCTQIQTIHNRINQLHIQPPEIGINEKKEIVADFITSIDDELLFFSKEDISTLQNNAAENDLCFAFKESVKLYFKGIERYDSIAKMVCSSPLIFNINQSLTINKANNSHLRNERINLNTYIEKHVKFRLLTDAFDKIKTDSSISKIYTKELDKEIRKNFVSEELSYYSKINERKNETEQLLLHEFLNSIAQHFDPHTNFFSLNEKIELDQSLSSEIDIFGIAFIENKDFEIEITNVSPGSSAWESNEIDEGDILEEIENRKKRKINLYNKGVGFLSEILSDPENYELTFYVRKKTGNRTKVTLVKKEVENDDNAFRGYIISDSINKFGYISLPSFYTDSENDSHLGCANDIAKEIILLKKDSIQGLVIDLRNNGGGSMKEAIELSGLFIDEGPIAVFQGKEQKPILLKDLNRGIVYNGPLIILVNHLSASASEFFTGCMQDYNRAIVVGSRTYGKGTAQSVFPLDSTINTDNNGFIKVTSGKFYHVSGRSNQETGIIPDIIINDLYSQIDFFLESNQKYHLYNDSTNKKVYYTPSQQQILPIVMDNSRERLINSDEYQKLLIRASELKYKIESDQIIPLSFSNFIQFKETEDSYWNNLDSINHFSSKIDISNHSFNTKMDVYNEAEKRFNENIILDLKNDFIINETFLILKDLIKFEN